jgi:putrescine aminotransferase
VQGEGGVRLPPPGYLRAVEAACRAHEALLVLDEVQSGLGRIGRWWGADLEDVRPDVLLCGKILGGGVLPVSAVVATDAAFAPLDRDPYLHSSTFGNSPVLAAAALATLEVIAEEGLVERSAQLGAQLLEGLRAVAAEHGDGLVTEVRGIGLLLGLQCADAPSAGELSFELVNRGVLPSYALTNATTVRLTPSALLSPAHVEQVLEAVAGALRTTRESIGAA